jgi:hypothetical protein
MIPIFRAGIPSSVNASTAFLNATRTRRLPTIAPCLWIDGAGKYTSGTRSATSATWRHHSPASPAVYGFDEMSRNGRAPRAARVRR